MLYRHVGDNSIFADECCRALGVTDRPSPHFRRRNACPLREKATSGPLLATYIRSSHGQQPATVMRETPLISGMQICKSGLSTHFRVSHLCVIMYDGCSDLCRHNIRSDCTVTHKRAAFAGSSANSTFFFFFFYNLSFTSLSEHQITSGA